jgi:antitoxin VapB
VITCSHLLYSRIDDILFAPIRGGDIPLNIRNEAVNQLAEKLAARKRMSKIDAVRTALENERRRLDEAVPLRQRLRPLQDRMPKRPATGLEADKAFYDELSGDG